MLTNARNVIEIYDMTVPQSAFIVMLLAFFL